MNYVAAVLREWACCKSCGAPLDWQRLERGGKPIPLDPEPRADGNLYLDGGLVRHVDLFTPRNVTRYVTHFATCPDAAAWRKPKEPTE